MKDQTDNIQTFELEVEVDVEKTSVNNIRISLEDVFVQWIHRDF